MVSNVRWGETVAAVVIGILLGILSIFKGTEVYGLMLTILVYGFFFLFCQYFLHDVQIRNILWMAFTLRVLLALINVYIFPLPDSQADAVTFERVGWEFAQYWMGEEREVQWISSAFLYSKFIGLIYYLFDRVPLIPHLLNVILGTLIVYNIYKIALRVTDDSKTAHLAAFVALFFPTLNLYSAILLRESLIVFLFSLSVLLFLEWFFKNNYLMLLLSVVPIHLASYLHQGTALILFVYLFVVVFYSPRLKKIDKFPVAKILFVSFAIVLYLVFFGTDIFKVFPEISALPQALSERLGYTSRGNAAYLIGLHPDNNLEAILMTPLRIIYFFFTPFPWMIEDAVHLIGFFDAILYMVLMYYSLKGLRHIWQRNKMLCIFLVLVLLVFAVVFAWGTSNFGTAARHRQKIVWLLIVLAAAGKSKSFLEAMKKRIPRRTENL